MAEMSPFSEIDEAIDDVRAGRMVVVCDDRNLGSDGNLLVAASSATPVAINFIAKEARGVICLALSADQCDRLGLEPMTPNNRGLNETAFTISVEARVGVTTGISAADRARTVEVAIDPRSAPEDLVRPGHVFPLNARAGGVLERPGHTEAAVDLARLAGLNPAAVICGIMKDDGGMATVEDLLAFCDRHRLRMVTVPDLVAYRRQREQLVERVVSTAMPTERGKFRAFGYRSLIGDRHHVALVRGEVIAKNEVPVAIHRECLAGDVFRSLRCDCGRELDSAMTRIEREGEGVLVYLTRETRASDRLDGLGGHPAERWDLAVAAQIVRDLGPASIRILDGGAATVRGLAGYGLSVS